MSLCYPEHFLLLQVFCMQDECRQEEMSVIASVVLGGASMAGGSGSMIGALAGSILMGMISNALILANLSSAQQKMVNGFIIIAAVALSNLAQRKKSN